MTRIIKIYQNIKPIIFSLEITAVEEIGKKKYKINPVIIQKEGYPGREFDQLFVYENRKNDFIQGQFVNIETDTYSTDNSNKTLKIETGL